MFLQTIRNTKVPVLSKSHVHIRVIVLLFTSSCYFLYVLGSNINLETGLSAVAVINRFKKEREREREKETNEFLNGI